MSKDFNPENLKTLLDEHYNWPTHYKFKFIIPKEKENEIMSKCLKGSEISKRPSTNGKYLSLTAQMKLNSSAEVLEVYKTASTIEGILSL